MLTGIYATLIKYALALLVLVAIVGGSWYGVDTIASAFRERTELRAQVTELKAARDAAVAKRDTDVAAANATTEQLRKEIDTRDALVAKQKLAQVTTEKELKNAQATLAQWRAHAAPDVDVCLRMPLPLGLFPGADQTATGGSGKN